MQSKGRCSCGGEGREDSGRGRRVRKAGNGTERVAGWRACSVEAYLPINLSASSSSPLLSPLLICYVPSLDVDQ